MSATTFLEYVALLQKDMEEIAAAGFAEVLTLTVDPRSAVRGFIKGYLQFLDGSVLHFREFVDLTLAQPKLVYAYHYQDAQGNLIFRYDNAAHKPPLPQREHKHTSSGVTLASVPTLHDVLSEILNYLPGRGGTG